MLKQPFALSLQIIQHCGPPPVVEDGGPAKPVLSRRPERQVSDLSAMRPKNSRHSQRPQHLGPNNVEGILTLQLSHPNVVQTFKAATRPLQVAMQPVVPDPPHKTAASTAPFVNWASQSWVYAVCVQSYCLECANTKCAGT